MGLPNHASMRPRQMPRNFSEKSNRRQLDRRASMRPRQMPRNFSPFAAVGASDGSCFNDAAEFYLARLHALRAEQASMRPRQMPRNFDRIDRVDGARSEASMRPRQMPRNF